MHHIVLCTLLQKGVALDFQHCPQYCSFAADMSIPCKLLLTTECTDRQWAVSHESACRSGLLTDVLDMSRGEAATVVLPFSAIAIDTWLCPTSRGPMDLDAVLEIVKVRCY